ncbi:deoxyribonuclease IV [Paenibacillus contaminans]|uniref:Endonuclease IV n=1 Tax=Paenibacillus contaminans TaxID=450362 RepID=A0A329MMR1_9BACL|nr:deoxyribonuclease IV [Paenibacillus contaminans]RAV20586.1 endonuclease IV [Paenibacillus contaminans]
MYIGSHISIRGGYLEAARTALKIGANAFQYFPKNPRSLTVKAFDVRDADGCAAFCRENGLLSIAHSPYPTNLMAEDDKGFRSTVASLQNDLEIADRCGSVGVVVHFGKWKSKDPLQGYKNSIQCLNEVLTGYEGDALLLIENQAGEGTDVGTTLEEMVHIRKLTRYPGKIGFCFDTCHAFASGLWAGSDWAALEKRGEELGYFEHLKAVHLNDSMYAHGSRRDRHANVNKGFIGEAHLRSLLQSAYIRHIPVVLETEPGKDRTHREEIAYARSIAEMEGAE